MCVSWAVCGCVSACTLDMSGHYASCAVCVCVCVCVRVGLCASPLSGSMNTQQMERRVSAHRSLFFQLQGLKGGLMNGEWILGPQQSGLLVNRCSTLGAERGRRQTTSNTSLCKKWLLCCRTPGCRVCLQSAPRPSSSPPPHLLPLLLHLHSSSSSFCASTTPPAPTPPTPPS